MLQAERVGITGTKNGATSLQLAVIKDVLILCGAKQFHHGDCVGVDAQAAHIATGMGLWVVAHPPVRDQYRAFAQSNESRPLADYLVRDKILVDEVEILFGVPKGFHEELRSGTWATIRYARKQQKPCYIIYPDGSIKSDA